MRHDTPLVPRLPVTAGTHQAVSATVPGARILLARFPKLLRISPHSHERACVTVLIEGRFSERLAGRDRDCVCGSVLAKPGLERHDDLFADMGSRQIIIEPDDRHPELMESCRALWNSVLHFHDLESERLARRLAVEIQHPDEVTPLAAAALTYELLVRTTRRRDVTRRLGTPPVWLEHARDRLQDAGRALPTLTILARGVGVHPAYLARLFRLHYGCSIGAFVRQRRVEAAATALLSTADTIAHIALDHGFADQSHFTRQFRRHIGLTPHEFRKRHRAG